MTVLPKFYNYMFGEKSTFDSLTSDECYKENQERNMINSEEHGESSLPYKIYMTLFGDHSGLDDAIEHHESFIKQGLLSEKDLDEFKFFIQKH